MHQRMGLNLPSSKPSGSPVLRARGRGTGPRSPAHSTARQRVLLRSLRGLQRTQTSTQSKQGFVVELETGTHEI